MRGFAIASNFDEGRFYLAFAGTFDALALGVTPSVTARLEDAFVVEERGNADWIAESLTALAAASGDSRTWFVADVLQRPRNGAA